MERVIVKYEREYINNNACISLCFHACPSNNQIFWKAISSPTKVKISMGPYMFALLRVMIKNSFVSLTLKYRSCKFAWASYRCNFLNGLMSPESNPFNKKTTLLEDFRVFKRLCFSCVSNMAASDLLAEVFARFSTCFRIFLADTASYLALRKSSSNPPKKGPPPF